MENLILSSGICYKSIKNTFYKMIEPVLGEKFLKPIFLDTKKQIALIQLKNKYLACRYLISSKREIV